MSGFTLPDVRGLSGVELALAFAEAELAVFRLDRASKQPLRYEGGEVVRWSETSTANPVVVKKWFADDKYDVGLDLYRSGLMAFDVDTPHLLPRVMRQAFRRHPTAYQSTRSNCVGRGHRVYALPLVEHAAADEPWLKVGSSPKPMQGGGDVKGFNSYISLGPRHAKAAEGGRHLWLLREVVELPKVLLDLLPVYGARTRGHSTATACTTAAIDWPAMPGEMDEMMQCALTWHHAFDQRAMTILQIRILQEHVDGATGGDRALRLLRDRYRQIRHGNTAVADATFARALAGAAQKVRQKNGL